MLVSARLESYCILSRRRTASLVGAGRCRYATALRAVALQRSEGHPSSGKACATHPAAEFRFDSPFYSTGCTFAPRAVTALMVPSHPVGISLPQEPTTALHARSRDLATRHRRTRRECYALTRDRLLQSGLEP